MGYGLIVPDDGGADVFVVADQLFDRTCGPRQGEAVQFTLLAGPTRPQAVDVSADTARLVLS